MAERSRLSADAKDALAREIPPDPRVRMALRNGLAFFGGVDVGGELVFRTRRPPVARLARTLFEEQRSTASVRRGHDQRLYKATTFEIDLGPAPAAVPTKPRRRDERRAELRAAFLCTGSVAAPAHGYHLEFVVADAARAERIAGLVAAEGLAPRTMVR